MHTPSQHHQPSTFSPFSLVWKVCYTLLLSTALTNLSLAKPAFPLAGKYLTTSSSITVIFERAIVKDSELNKTLPNTILKITPALDGNIRWETSTKLIFIPKAAPALDSSYTFSVSPGLSDLSNTPIAATELGTIYTPKLKLDFHRVISNFQTTAQPVSYLRFNENVDAAAAQPFFYYTRTGKEAIPAKVTQATRKDGQSYYTRPIWREYFELNNNGIQPQTKHTLGNSLLVSPASPLPVGKAWQLIVTANLDTGTCDARFAKPYKIKIGDFAAFNINSSVPIIRVDEPRRIKLYTNHKIAPDQNLKQLIKISPTPTDYEIKQLNDTTLSITGDLEQQDLYAIQINSALKAQNGQTIGSRPAEQIKFTPLHPSLSLPSFTSAQLATGARDYQLRAINLQSLDITVKLLDTDSTSRTLQAYRNYSGNDHDYKIRNSRSPLPIELINGKTIFTHRFSCEQKLNTSFNTTLDWDKILPQEARTGTLFIEARGTPDSRLPQKIAKSRIAQSIVQLTDIGLAWKFTKDHTWIYAYSLQSGKPLPKVTVELLGEDTKLLHSSITDTSGIAKLTRSPHNGKADRHIIASLGNDRYMTAFDSSTSTVSLWRFPINYDWEAKNYWDRELMLFTDRTLYKPGQTVHLKGIAREYFDNITRLPVDKTLTLECRSPENKTLFTEDITLSEHGSFDHTFTLPDDIVGRFHLQANYAQNDQHQSVRRKSSFYHSINVQEFRRNAFKVSSVITPPGVGTHTVECAIAADYYQGTPVANGKVQWYLNSYSKGFYPDKYRDFYFGDHRAYDNNYWSHYFGYNDSYENYGNQNNNSHSKNGSLVLNKQGKDSFSLDIPELEFPNPQQVVITSEITDSRTQSLSSVARTTIHPTSSYIGISRIDKLMRVGEEIEHQLIHVGLDGNQLQSDLPATLKIERIYHETTRIVSPKGKTKTENTARTEHIESRDIILLAGKATPFAFTPQKNGKYIITISAKDATGNPMRTACSDYVYGADDYPWATEDGMKIKLIAEKKSYEAGDSAKILVLTPIEGTALVTIERMGILHSFIHELKTDTPTIDIPITEGYAPNAFVSVLLIRGADSSPAKHKQATLKFGVCQINVNPSSNKLNLALEAPTEEQRPGENTTIAGTVTDHVGQPLANAEVTLYAEDEGVLAVDGYKNPKPFDFFFFKRPLTLMTGVSLNDILSEDTSLRYFSNKGFTIGGGYLSEVSRSADSPLKLRSDFNPCAIWQPALITDANGRFSTTFKLPDTLTSYRVIATAIHGKDRFGSAQDTIVVNKKLMLEPFVPRFANEGDLLKTKLLIQNNSEHSGTWLINLQADEHVDLSSGQPQKLTQEVTLQPKSSKTIHIPVQFTNTGTSTWTWTATPTLIDSQRPTPALAEAYSDHMETSIAITYPRPLLRDIQNLVVHDTSSMNVMASIPKDLRSGRGKITLNFSRSRLSVAGQAMDFLLQYPYGCVEQTSSATMPWLAYKDLKNVIPAYANKKTNEVTKAIQAGVDRLLTMQTDSGGFSYWPNQSQPTKWSSSYAGIVLVKAKEQGANIPDGTLEKLARFTIGYLRSTDLTKASVWEKQNLCRSLYLLTLLDQADAATLNHYYDKLDTLDRDARAYLALAFVQHGENTKHDGLAQHAISILLAEDKLQTEDLWMSHHNSDALQLIALSQLKPDSEQTNDALTKLLKKRGPNGHWQTTWCNSWSLLALAEYQKSLHDNDTTSTLHLTYNGNEHTIQLDNTTPTYQLALALPLNMPLQLSTEGKCYLQTQTSSKPALAPFLAESTGGFAIKREYLRVDNNGKTSPLTEPKLGDLVQVNLDITMPRAARYLAIDDPLPATFEIVNTDFVSQSSHHSNKLRPSYQISRQEFRDERALFFYDQTWGNGTQRVSYLARITTAGTCQVPPAKIEAMYEPQIRALSGASTMKVSDK